MNKRILSVLLLTLMMCFLLTACGEVENTEAKDYPKIDELSWSFRNTVRYEKPVAAFDYTNNSDFTIVQLSLYFKMKDGVTAEQLQLISTVTGELIPDEEIPDMEPYVLDWIVCDPGETAENAVCYMMYNTEPTNTNQCELMELNHADICYIGKDGKGHTVSYSAENGGYSVSEIAKDLFVWSESDYAKMIPKPETRIASVVNDDDECLYVKAYDISFDYFLAYIDECEKLGFVDDYPDEDVRYNYHGTNADGYRVHIRFIDYMHYIEITLEAADEQSRDERIIGTMMVP